MSRVNHVIILMQENHSFDNYFGALTYAPGSPYHLPTDSDAGASRGCAPNDHTCVDGLSCRVNSDGSLACLNSNADDDGSTVFAFHNPSRCVVPDLNHEWAGTHQEINFQNPADTLSAGLNDGFVRVNDVAYQPDIPPTNQGSESPTDDEAMGFYTQDDLPFYYNLAENFAIDDRYFSSVLGPTTPNRAFLMAATSFGHLSTSDVPKSGFFMPITGTIFDLLDKNGIAWTDYYLLAPQARDFHAFSGQVSDPHFGTIQVFLAQLDNDPEALPPVIFLDTNVFDEHPPVDIQRGQAYVSNLLVAIRYSAIWKDSIIFLTYDEHGGYYDHVAPPLASQGGQRTPDGISPGQCSDLSNPPASLQPGGGAACATFSMQAAETLCPELAANPTGPYPAHCPSFDQLGARVPFLAISPFSKPHYVSHTVGDHTSMLAFIEKRFLTPRLDSRGNLMWQYLTLRDQYADTLEDLFDFDNSPSLNVPISPVGPPVNDCTPP